MNLTGVAKQYNALSGKHGIIHALHDSFADMIHPITVLYVPQWCPVIQQHDVGGAYACKPSIIIKTPRLKYAALSLSKFN